MWYSVYVTYLFIAATMALLGIGLAWQRRTVPGARSLMVFLCGACWWVLCDALAALSPNALSAELFEAKLRFISVTIVGPIFLLIALEYIGRTEWFHPPRLALLFVIPALLNTIIWFGPSDAFIQNITYVQNNGLWLPETRTFGPWFYLHAAYSYTLVFGSLLILLNKVYSASFPDRSQAMLLSAGLSILILVSLLRTYGTGSWLRVDWIAVGLIGPILLWPYGLLQYHRLDLAPVARSLLIEQMNDLVIVLDARHRVIDFNAATQHVFGWDLRGILGKPVDEALPDQWFNSLIDLTNLTEDTHSELTINDRIYDLRVSPLYHHQRQPAGNLLVLRDITDHKATQYELAANEAQLAGLLTALPDIVLHLDRAGTYLDMHGDPQDLLRLSKLPRGTLIGTTIFDLLPQPEAQQIHAAINRALDTGEIQTIEYELPTVSGQVQFESRYAPISDNDVIVLARDVTQRIKMENALRAREAETRVFQEYLLALHHVTMKLAQVSDLPTLYRHIIELARSELGIDRIGLYLVDEDDPSMMRGVMGTDPQGNIRDESSFHQPIKDDIRLCEALEAQTRYAFWEDNDLWDQQQIIGHGWNAMALLWNGAKSIGWIVSDNLITQQPMRSYELELMALYGTAVGYLITKLRSESALRASEARYRTVVETSPDAIGIVTNRLLTFASTQMMKMLKADHADQVIGTSALQWIAPEDQERAQLSIQRIMAGGPPISSEYTLLDTNGNTFIGEFRSNPLYDNEGHVVSIISIVRDVTERNLMDEALRESEARYRTLVEMFPDAIATTDLHGKITFVSPRTIEIFQANHARDFIGTRVLDWVASHDHARVMGNIDGVSQGQLGVDNQYAMRTKSGNEFIGEVRSNVLVDAAGQPSAILSVIRDVTERVQAEERRVELEMEKERTKIFQQFISHASHDLKTPLTNIKMHLYLLDNVTQPEQQIRYRHVLDEQVAHLEQLLEDMLSMSRLDKDLSFKFEAVKLNSLLPIVIARYAALALSHDQQLDLDVPPDLPLVQADPVYLAQAVMNLIANAVHYTPRGGAIRVQSYPQDESVIIEVVDNGIGINTNDLSRVFERFFRADPARGSRKGGAGLGLPIAKRIIEAHSGTISVESAPETGTRFHITLPAFHPISELPPPAE